MSNVTRRLFLQGLLGATAAGAAQAAPLRFFKPTHVDNPLAAYPGRDWEETYRNIFKPDSSFVFLCAPNDTHNCLLRAYVKNGIVVRIGPTFGYGKAKDLYGNTASHRWDPRLCQKGLALVRRIYGDRRVKAPMIRTGWKAWVDAGFPRDASGKPEPRYFERGKDTWTRASWDDACGYAARALDNIIRTYSGEEGTRRLRAQGYDPSMIEALDGAGTQTVKLRGGMAFLGATRIFGLYRFASSLALADAKVRGVGPDQAHGGRGWDSYSWHTDLPPGHPMGTGAQTNDFDLFTVENSKLCVVWGMNWITTKMPDSHWLTEARLKGTRVVVVTVEYSATASKGDEVVVIRPGTDPAFALGLAQVIVSQKLYDQRWVETNTDLPFLVRMDTLQPLRPEELATTELPGYRARPAGGATLIKQGDKAPAPVGHKGQYLPEALAADFGAYVIADARSKKLVAINRDQVGPRARATAPDLHARREVTLADGKKVEVRTHFALLAEYLDQNMTPAQVSQLTGAPASAIEQLARQIAANPEKTTIATGMGPNQFFNADLKDRAILLVAALTRNLGFPGGNVGSYAGNYRSALFGGLPLYAAEDPFQLQLDPAGEVKTRKYSTYESLHYYNYGDRPLRVGNKLFTGQGHLPTPTKAMWLNNSNSVIANVKWHYDVVHNTLPKIEFIAFADWWWTASCEYADIVFAADSWAEMTQPDLTGSCTNPFVQVFPSTPLPRVFDTKPDLEIIAGVGRALAKLLDEPRLADAWRFADGEDVGVYLQRIIDGSASLRGYRFDRLHALAKEGVPALLNVRTYPRNSSFEHQQGEQPWHTKSGRLEFYRFEPEFVESGENLVVYREPIDSTFHEPNVIVAAAHPALRPTQPQDYGLAPTDTSVEVRQVRHVMRTVSETMASQHPLMARGYRHIYHTPKYRHGAHTTPVDTDFTSVLFGPFGDVYRHDKRLPSVTEGYMDIHPLDARELGLDDGDYVYVDADPEDRPFRGYKGDPKDDASRLSRLMLRVRYYPGTPRNVARTWHNMYGATYGSMRGHETRKDGLAKNPDTNYQSMYRYGSHQSATRAWLKPTLMTETLVHKDMVGQTLMKGFLADVHCPVGAPREAFVKLTRAEPGGVGGSGLWRPAAKGFRPTYESAAMKAYLSGEFTKVK